MLRVIYLVSIRLYRFEEGVNFDSENFVIFYKTFQIIDKITMGTSSFIDARVDLYALSLVHA